MGLVVRNLHLNHHLRRLEMSERFVWTPTSLECNTRATPELDLGVRSMLESVDGCFLLPKFSYFTEVG